MNMTLAKFTEQSAGRSMWLVCLFVCAPISAFIYMHAYRPVWPHVAVDECELVALNKSFYETRIVDMAKRKKIRKKVIDENK